MTVLGLKLMVALVLVLKVGQKEGVGFTFGLGLTPGLEIGFWLRLGVVLEVTLVLGWEMGIEVGSKLGLLVEIGTVGFGLAANSFIVAAADISVLWELLWSGRRESKADLGLSFPIKSLTVLLCMGRRGMIGIPELSSNWLRDVGPALRVGETWESCILGALCAGCLSTVPP